MYTLVYHPKKEVNQKNIIKPFKLQISLIKKVQRNTKATADTKQEYRRLWYCRILALKKFPDTLH